MTLRRSARNVAVILATFNFVFPVSLLQASDRTAPDNAVRSNEYRSHITDIALEKGGRFTGHVLDVQGRPSVDFKVAAVQNGKQIDTVSTDSRGRFQISHLRGGMFQLTAGPHTYLCRGWAPGTAPPAAAKQLLIVPPGVVERGQRPFSDLFFADPLLVGLVVAAAIAIPIAVSSSRNDRPSGS